MFDDGPMSDVRSILFAIDDPRLIDVAPVVDLALATGWPLRLLHVAPAPTAGPATSSDPEAGAGVGVDESTTRDRFDPLVGGLLAEGIDAELTVAVGPVIEVILHRADEWNAAMIAVGGSRHQAANRLVLASTTSALLKVAGRPVLVVPSDHGEAQPDEGFRSSLERLIDRIDREEGAGMAELRQAADDQLAEPSSTAQGRRLFQRLTDSVERFETDHPSLVRAINDVSYYLSGMGI